MMRQHPLQLIRRALATQTATAPTRSFQGIKPYKTDLDSIHPNPLLELQKASFQRGIADTLGYRLTGAPWGFALAELPALPEGRQGQPNQPPSVRTIGFQRISELGMDWLTKRPQSTKAKEASSKTASTQTTPVALCYTEGIYPPPTPNDSCEQWRAEGTPFEIPVSEVLETAPMASFAQIVATARQSRETASSVAGGQPQRSPMENRDDFLALVQKVKKELEDGQVSLSELELAVQVVRLVPDRIELLASGEVIWERFEWTRNKVTGEWSVRRQMMPY